MAADSQKFTGGEVSKAKKSDDLQKEPGPITLRLQRDGVSDLGCNLRPRLKGYLGMMSVLYVIIHEMGSTIDTRASETGRISFIDQSARVDYCASRALTSQLNSSFLSPP